eukprot:CAMPEP_0116151918 /NCGR_PEP_ID=MMETSP0329-20121206/20367_1 /TAXON_ID=697910 /ORGANISM="Pseudo-nitzschia arenysensis, Strain B593" /LENGTH=55 /DNA_ID=CAMNT_0003648591 /DNA_START=71 /DNA_END=235 /DNA_ORIENTATION=+
MAELTRAPVEISQKKKYQKLSLKRYDSTRPRDNFFPSSPCFLLKNTGLKLIPITN